MNLRHSTAAGAAALVLSAVLCAASTGFDTPSARFVTDPSDLLEGPAATGAIGDVLIENGAASFIVTSVANAPGGAISGGHLVDAIPTGMAASDLLGYVFGTLGDWPRQAVYDTIRILAPGPEAVVVASGTDSDEPGLEVVTRYRLAAGVPWLRIDTVLTNTTGSAVSVVAGDAIGWGMTEHFVPGYGSDVTGTATLYDDWIAGEGDSVSYGYAPSAGSMACTHGLDWTDTAVLTRSIAPGDSVIFTRYLSVGTALSDASDAAHAVRGTSVGTLMGAVTSGATGEPLPGTTVECDVSGIAPYTRFRTRADGSFRATLPHASYSAVASVDGYYDEDVSFGIVAGETTRVSIELNPTAWNADKADTLTYVMRPILSIPSITTPGGSFVIEALAPTATTGWQASLRNGSEETGLAVAGASFDAARDLWTMTATVSEEASLGMHDLVVTASGGVADTVAHSVCVRSSIDDAFYVVHVTDTHLPTHNFSSDGVAGLADSSEMVDFREVIRDINTINPDFVIMTGDLVNEGELEDYLGERVFTRAFRLLKSLDVPVYVVPGNHDIGGWPTTPPADGTSRHDWWRFFGWRYLNDPPAGMPLHTQNYSFDYGGIHFVGLEAYDNYDYWRPEIYGPYSFTDDQMAWLQDDLDAAGAATPTVLFYHYDFGDDINLSALGVECALWGHIHVSSGSITQAPYNLATGSVCDGRRLMRLVRFDDGAVIPSSTISSGSQGLLLNTAYEPANDGSSSTITATVTNGTAERFEHAAVRFRVPSADAPYTIDVGTLVQTLVEDDVAECLVTLDVPAHGDAVVTISPDTTSGPVPDVPTLYQSDPNPARTGASISFSLASAGHVTLRVYDVAGRLVATPFSGDAAAGPNNVRWDLRGSGGSRVASGIYFYRLTGDGFEITRKLVVVR